MGKIGILMAGQGSQYIGMGNDLSAETYIEEFRKINPELLDMMHNGSLEELSKTINTQPSVFLVDLLAANALREHGIVGDCVAGFSLGEVAALTYAGVFDFSEGIKLVNKRANLMHEISEGLDGCMSAVLKFPEEELESLCKDYNVYPVNYNCPGQVVVAGIRSNMEEFEKKLCELKVRCVRLQVSGAFHTPYMAMASSGLERELEYGGYVVKSPSIKVYANIDGNPYETEDRIIIKKLSMQISNGVRFEKTLKNMYSDGVDTFIECGPGKVLSGFVKKTLKDVKVYNVSDSNSLKETVEAIQNEA